MGTTKGRSDDARLRHRIKQATHMGGTFVSPFTPVATDGESRYPTEGMRLPAEGNVGGTIGSRRGVEIDGDKDRYIPAGEFHGECAAHGVKARITPDMIDDWGEAEFQAKTWAGYAGQEVCPLCHETINPAGACFCGVLTEANRFLIRMGFPPVDEISDTPTVAVPLLSAEERQGDLPENQVNEIDAARRCKVISVEGRFGNDWTERTAERRRAIFAKYGAVAPE